jgi:hypothetical protein
MVECPKEIDHAGLLTTSPPVEPKCPLLVIRQGKTGQCLKNL